MFELLRTIFKVHWGAIWAIALLHIFTFIPASMVFWMEKSRQNHLYYFGVIASVAIITSWVFHTVTSDVKNNIRHFTIKMELLFAILAVLSAPFLLTFYLQTAVLLSNFFETTVQSQYAGPNRLISALVIFAFYNLFFFGDLVRSLKRKKIPVEPFKPALNFPGKT
jgi:hypothetical protein